MNSSWRIVSIPPWNPDALAQYPQTYVYVMKWWDCRKRWLVNPDRRTRKCSNVLRPEAGRRRVGPRWAADRLGRAVEERSLDADVVVEPLQMSRDAIDGRGCVKGGVASAPPARLHSQVSVPSPSGTCVGTRRAVPGTTLTAGSKRVVSRRSKARGCRVPRPAPEMDAGKRCEPARSGQRLTVIA